MKRVRVTGPQVLDFLAEERLLTIPVDAFGFYEKKLFQSADRGVRRFLKKQEGERGQQTGNLVCKESVVLHQQNYLKAGLSDGGFAFQKSKETSCEAGLTQIRPGVVKIVEPERNSSLQVTSDILGQIAFR